MIETREFCVADGLDLQKRLRTEDAGVRQKAGYESHLKRFTASGPAETMLLDGEVLCAYGIYIHWHHVGEGWVLCAKEVEEHPYIVSKMFRQRLGQWIDEYKLHRVQAMVNAGWHLAINMIKHLGFEYEGTLRKFGAGGEDFCMYALIKENNDV